MLTAHCILTILIAPKNNSGANYQKNKAKLSKYHQKIAFSTIPTCQNAFDDENKNLFQRENVSVHPQGSGTLWLYSFRSNNGPETLFIER